MSKMKTGFDVIKCQNGWILRDRRYGMGGWGEEGVESVYVFTNLKSLAAWFLENVDEPVEQPIAKDSHDEN